MVMIRNDFDPSSARPMKSPLGEPVAMLLAITTSPSWYISWTSHFRSGMSFQNFVTAGPGHHTVDFQRHRLTEGSVLHVAAGQVQQFSLDRRLDATMVVFEPDFVRHAPTSWSGPRVLPPPRRATVAALCEALKRECGAFDRTPGALALLSTLVEALVLAVESEGTDDNLRDAPLLARFRAALERSLSRAREVAAYAAVLDCSPRTLTRACERATGRSAKQLIDERVALEARRLLAHGGQPAAAISAQLGFAEPTQFGKFFRRVTGETPADFRDRFGAPRQGRKGSVG